MKNTFFILTLGVFLLSSCNMNYPDNINIITPDTSSGQTEPEENTGSLTDTGSTDENDDTDVSQSGSTTQTELYINTDYDFQTEVPVDFTINDDYSYDVNTTTETSGVAFMIDESLYEGTNLSSDTYVSVERVNADSLEDAEFLDADMVVDSFDDTIAGRDYRVIISQGAAAGNRYTEKIYAFQEGEYIYAVRYFIHYGVIENYVGTDIIDFNEEALLDTFDTVRDYLEVNTENS